MANNLLFKKGLHANLQNVAISENTLGTVYFTTDEGGMYLDTKVNGELKRVRVQGSVLYFDDLNDFVTTMEPPYSTDVLYFIAKSTTGNETKIWNALMRWDGNQFIQLNVTASDFENLRNTVGDANSGLVQLVNQHTQLLTGLRTDLDALGQRVTNLDKADGTIADLTKRLSDAEDEIDQAQIAIGTLEGVVGDDNGGLVKDVKANAQAIKSIQENYVKVSDYNEDQAEIDQSFESIRTQVNNIYSETEGGVKSGLLATVQNDLDALEVIVVGADGQSGLRQTVTAQGQAISDVQIDIANNVKVPLAKAVEDLGNLTGTVSGIDGRLQPVEAEVSRLSGVIGNDSSGLVKDVKANGQTISNINLRLGSVALPEGSDSITDAIADLDGRTNGIASEVLSISQDITNNIKPTVSDNTERIVKLENALGEGGEGVAGVVASHTQAIKALQDKDATIEEDLGKLEQALADEAKARAEADAKIREDFAAEDVKLSNRIKDYEDNKSRIDQALAAAATKQELNEAVSGLNDKITNEIHAANAMNFRSDIEVANSDHYTALNLRPDMAVGDTVIVKADFTSAEGVAYHAGDLLVAKSIAAGTAEDPYEVNGKIPVAKLDFIQVDTGYIASHNPKLVATTDANSNTTALILKDHVGGSLSTINFKTQSGLEITTSDIATNSATVNINMVWGEFF